MSWVLPYEFYQTAPLQTADFLTACIPELLNRLSPAIFMLLLEKTDLKTAEAIIKRDALYH